jgi:hypothetical protein
VAIRAAAVVPTAGADRNGRDAATAWLMVLAGLTGMLVTYALRRKQLARRQV